MSVFSVLFVIGSMAFSPMMYSTSCLFPRYVAPSQLGQCLDTWTSMLMYVLGIPLTLGRIFLGENKENKLYLKLHVADLRVEGIHEEVKVAVELDEVLPGHDDPGVDPLVDERLHRVLGVVRQRLPVLEDPD